MDQMNYLLTNYPWVGSIVDRLVRVVFIILVVFVCAKLIKLVCNHILVLGHKVNATESHAREREKRLATVVRLMETSLRVMLFGAALLMVLREFGLDITPLLTGAGIAGVALGFGSQSLVKDMIAGFFLLIEDQIRIGDVIRINNGLSGSVERMELRVTAIRDGDGTLHIVPNGEIKSVSNMTYDFSQAVVEIPVPYQSDVKKLNAILESVTENLDQDPRFKSELRGKPQVLGITKFEATHMVMQIVVKTEPHSQWPISREIRKRVKFALDDAGFLYLNTSPIA